MDYSTFWLREYFRYIRSNSLWVDVETGATNRVWTEATDDGGLIILYTENTGPLGTDDYPTILRLNKEGKMEWKLSAYGISGISYWYVNASFADSLIKTTWGTYVAVFGNLIVTPAPYSSTQKNFYVEFKDDGTIVRNAGIDWGPSHYASTQSIKIVRCFDELLIATVSNVTGAAAGVHPRYTILPPEAADSGSFQITHQYVMDDPGNITENHTPFQILASDGQNKFTVYQPSLTVPGYPSLNGYEYVFFAQMGTDKKISTAPGVADCRYGTLRFMHHPDYSGGGHFDIATTSASQGGFLIDGNNYYVSGGCNIGGIGWRPFIAKAYYDDTIPGWTGWMTFYQEQTGKEIGNDYEYCKICNDVNDPSCLIAMMDHAQLMKVRKLDGEVVWGRTPPYGGVGPDPKWYELSDYASVMTLPDRIVWVDNHQVPNPLGATSIEVMSCPYAGDTDVDKGNFMFEPTPRWKDVYHPWYMRTLIPGNPGITPGSDGDIPVFGIQDALNDWGIIVREYVPNVWQVEPP